MNLMIRMLYILYDMPISYAIVLCPVLHNFLVVGCQYHFSVSQFVFIMVCYGCCDNIIYQLAAKGKNCIDWLYLLMPTNLIYLIREVTGTLEHGEITATINVIFCA